MRISQTRRTARQAVLLLILVAAALSWLPAAPMHARVAVDSPEPAGPPAPRVGLQVGHWQIADLPASLARLRGDTGTTAAGRTEVSLNLEFARRVAGILEAQGVAVDLLPATVPTGYRADAFVAIHADGQASGQARGYKIATRWRSSVAERDLVLLDTLDADYGDVTGLPPDGAITRNMRGYYAINTWLGDQSRISDLTPAVIIETGYMTNAADRRILFNRPDVVAAGIARGILQFLANAGRSDAAQARAAAVAAASPTQRSVVVLRDGVAIRAAKSAGAPIVARANRGDSLTYLDTTVRPHGPFTTANLHGAELAAGIGSYRVALPGGGSPVYISRDAIVVQQPAP